MKRFKVSTCTTLVLEALRAQDDFMDYAALRAATKCNANQVSAACYSLRQYQVVDCVINPDGRAWWFALPPEQDTRTSTLAERTPESSPRKRRKRRQGGSRRTS